MALSEADSGLEGVYNCPEGPGNKLVVRRAVENPEEAAVVVVCQGDQSYFEVQEEIGFGLGGCLGEILLGGGCADWKWRVGVGVCGAARGAEAKAR